MKKFLATTLASLVLVSMGAAFAQSSQSHDVTVNVPAVLMIRMTNGASNAAVVTPGGVTFDAAADPDGDFSGTFEPSFSGNAWDNIRVFVNRTGNWQVSVATSNATFDWSKITNSAEDPFGAGEISFALPVNGSASLVDNDIRTNGWRSLAISPMNYRLALDGTEDEGTFSTVVTYSIASF